MSRHLSKREIPGEMISLTGHYHLRGVIYLLIFGFSLGIFYFFPHKFLLFVPLIFSQVIVALSELKGLRNLDNQNLKKIIFKRYYFDLSIYFILLINSLWWSLVYLSDVMLVASSMFAVFALAFRESLFLLFTNQNVTFKKRESQLEVTYFEDIK